MFVAIVVLPTPPFGLKTTTIWARRPQSSRWTGSDCMTGPLPSSTVLDRMSIASIRQRSDSAEYGRVKYSSLSDVLVIVEVSRSSARGDTTMRAAIARPPSWRRE